MKNSPGTWLKTCLIIGLFVLLTLIFFRHVLTSQPDTLLSKHLATDLYGHFVHIHERLPWLVDGFLPFGDYWVDRGGGFPAASNDQLFIPQEFMAMVIYWLTGDLLLTLKILYPLFYLLSLLTAFWYGITLFKQPDAAALLAVAYTFSMYGLNQWEHLELIGVPFLIVLTLTFIEKAFQKTGTKYAMFAGFCLFLVLMSNFSPFVFTGLYLVIRVAWQFIRGDGGRLAIARTTCVTGLTFGLLAVPYVIPNLSSIAGLATPEQLSSEIARFARPAYLYFIRDAPFVPYQTEIYFMYLGISVVALALFPFVLRSSGALKSLYLFNIFICAFFLIYAIGPNSPFDVATFFHDRLPFFSLVRVPGRALVIGYLNLAVCAAIGYTLLREKLAAWLWKSRGWQQNVMVGALCLALLGVIYGDLTAGFEPTTKPMLFKDNAAYDYIAEQPGDSRALELPSVHDQQAMTMIYTGRDVLNPVQWAFASFAPLKDFSQLYFDYAQLGNSPNFAGGQSPPMQQFSFNFESDDTVSANSSWAKDVTEVPGSSGQGVYFNGTESKIVLPAALDPHLTMKGTISFNVKLPPEDEAVEQGWIIGKGAGWSRTGWAVTTINKNRVRFQWQSGQDIILDSAQRLTYDEWHNVAAIYDGRNMRIYVDGQRDANEIAVRSVDATSVYPLALGISDNGNLPFRGVIDEVNFYGSDAAAEASLPLWQARSSTLADKAAYYGVEYIIINTDPAYFHGTSDIPPYVPITQENMETMTSLLTVSPDFSLVFQHDNISVFKNLRYRGRVFLVPLSVFNAAEPFPVPTVVSDVQYARKDPNSLQISFSTDEAAAVVISQSYAEGWTADVSSPPPSGTPVKTSVPVKNTASVQYIEIDTPGNYQINLRYTHQKNSLFTYAGFYVPLVIISAGLAIQRRLKSHIVRNITLVILFVYGAGVTIFSLLFYNAVFPGALLNYRLATLALGTGLAGATALWLIIIAVKKRRIRTLS